jgi:opacity protein-like surface antigen
MTRWAVFGAAFTLLMSSSAAWAQSWEVSGLAGLTPTVGLDNRAPELDELDIAGGFTWGVQGGRSFTPHWAAEVLWTDQSSALRVGTDAGSADLFTMSVRQLHGNAVYHFADQDRRVRPFLFAGLGATFFSADHLESETKLSWGLGGGLKYYPWRALGIRAHFRYRPTQLNDEDAGAFCDPFGFCQGSLRQVEFAAGAVVRF